MSRYVDVNDRLSLSGWEVVREIGITRRAGGDGARSPFRGPASVEPGRGDDELILLDKCPNADRVFLVRHGRASPLRLDAFRDRPGFIGSVSVVGPDHFLILGGDNPREVILVDRDGRLRARVWSSWSPGVLNWPRCAAMHGDGVVVGDQATRKDGVYRPASVVELGLDGRVRWRWCAGPEVLGEPAHITSLGSDRLIITDPELQRVIQFIPPSGIGWTYGRAGQPGSEVGSLSVPSATTLTPSGTLLISDTRNDRIVEIGQDGRFLDCISSNPDALGVVDGPLCSPASAFQTGTGGIIVADYGNKRIVELDRSGRIRSCIGPADVPRRQLSFPRSVETVKPGRWLIADTNHNRVIELDAQGNIRWQYGRGLPRPGCTLSWPRSARRMGDGSTLICDSLHRRLLIVSRDGRLVSEISSISLESGERLSLRDPHEAIPTPRGTILVVDSLIPLLAEIDRDGSARWSLGGPGNPGVLADPHQVVMLGDGTACLCNSSRSELLIINPDGSVVKRVSSLRFAGGKSGGFSRPKALLATPQFLAVADGFVAEYQLVLLDVEGVAHGVDHLMDAGSQRDDEDLLRLHEPRGLAYDDGRLIVSDWSSHRLLELKNIASD